ncbi:MAG: type II secretion system protein [Candidatus Saccharimonadales bacterium]
MNVRLQRGFTIVELILFLGITGILFVSLMMGVNTSISTQQYKESAVTVKTFLERQFTETMNPRNIRDDNWSCTQETGIIQDAVNGVPRGTSRCVVLGRYITVHGDGTRLRAGDVIGIEPSDTVGLAAGDMTVLRAYTPRLSPVGVEEVDVTWQSRLQTHDHGVSSASFIIVRSPQSGIIRTFTTNATLPENDLTPLFTKEHMDMSETLCVMPSSLVAVPTHSVRIDPRVGSVAGIVLNENDEACY